MSKQFEYKILNLAGDLGELLLENGSEVYRVENSISSLIKYFGFSSQCFATLTCIIITLENSNKEIISLVRRVKKREVNLNKVYKVSTLIKNLDKYEINTLENNLRIIKLENSYSFFINSFGNCIGASFFSILFLGDFYNFISSFFSGFLISIFLKLSNKINLGIFFTNLLGSFIVTSISYFFYHIYFISNPSITIISTLMLLVPGVSFINSMRDIFAGDLVTGVSRLMEVLMIGSSIAVGSGIAINFFQN
ncbi:threonine/serine ThrE exporter family protein [Fusobacterium perfoetens]|uniref:threonine/serine ThrE exporter family protein n=1 Tax=Fusobacterium perfoetens TaxID=852 RepID=UPI000485A690|nr:threonine/serine exporter family protein [Fusobacterium perfoetens]MCI6151679.1 threonine/serine exporter family protein [Fusobacterium perfoetens]MDY3236565.1 threonine/serine exporter family protein [Fusobacterium perfoetens]